MNENIRALIAVKSNEMQDALQALLESVKRINTIYQATNEQTMLEIITAHQPVLVLVDFDLFDAISKHPITMLIALVDSRTEQDYAKSKGADWVFMKGSSVSQLVSTIESLLTIGNINGEDM